MSFHDRTTKEVFRELNSSEKGLTSYEADKRLQQYGRNVLGRAKKLTLLKLTARQFTSPLVWVLLGAMGISFVVGERTDFYIIGVIVVLNTVLGVFQEYRAERAIEALQKLTALKARVLRDGREISIDAADLVPGDVVLLETGDKVPADLRLFETVNFQTQEAALTGESTPVNKQTDVIKKEAGVADRKNLAYTSTIITAGRAQGIVISTGTSTEIGKIATLIHETESVQTPLQKQLQRLSKWITILVLAIAAIVFAAGVLQGQPILMFLLAAIALAVAAIPEGLPAVVTVALALGVQRMAQRNALIRKLPSAETLGSCTVICADKTGTLTHNQMTVRKLWVDNTIVNVTGTGYETDGTFSSHPKDLTMLLTIGMLNNNSKVTGSTVIGDPTEAALVVSGRKAGLNEQKLNVLWPRIAEIEFTSERKKMTTFHKKGKTFAFVKGAPDVILHTCTKMLLNGKLVPLTPVRKKAVLDAQQAFANDALRVLGFAYREMPNAAFGNSRTKFEKTNDIKTETRLVFVGLQAMIDPPREEVKQAIIECSTAGIKVVMITGDHLGTAYAIGRELGIPGRAITGEELEKIPDLAAVVNDIGIYARVNPEHKLKIVAALQARHHVVAMTGDGVNDAPALKQADIGIGMGSGTDVAKEASVMILADDNFASIVAAVKEGRRIYDNLANFIMYLFSSNIGEVLTVFGALVIGMPLPMLAIQLLWINLVTDGLPALALSVDPAAPNIMARKPRPAGAPLITRGRGLHILTIGTVMMLGTLFLFSRYEGVLANTIAFTTLVVMQLFNVLNQREQLRGLWVWIAIGSSLALQFLVVYVLSTIFKTAPLSALDWIWITLVSASVLVVGQLLRKVKPLSNGG